jgi:hypothetical protein
MMAVGARADEGTDERLDVKKALIIVPVVTVELAEVENIDDQRKGVLEVVEQRKDVHHGTDPRAPTAIGLELLDAATSETVIAATADAPLLDVHGLARGLLIIVGLRVVVRQRLHCRAR